MVLFQADRVPQAGGFIKKTWNPTFFGTAQSEPFGSAIPKLFERDSNLSSVNTSRPMPQTVDEKSNELRGRFLAVSCQVRFQCQQSTRFSRTYATDRQGSSGNVENIQLKFGSPRRDPVFDPSRLLFGSQPRLREPLV